MNTDFALRQTWYVCLLTFGLVSRYCFASLVTPPLCNNVEMSPPLLHEAIVPRSQCLTVPRSLSAVSLTRQLSEHLLKHLPALKQIHKSQSLVVEMRCIARLATWKVRSRRIELLLQESYSWD